MKNGEKNYQDWKKRNQSITYIFREQSEKLFETCKVDEVFDCSRGHPIIVKKYLAGEVSVELMVIYDKIFSYIKDFDKKLPDPVWETISAKLKKYSSFMQVDVFKYKKLLKSIILSS